MALSKNPDLEILLVGLIGKATPKNQRMKNSVKLSEGSKYTFRMELILFELLLLMEKAIYSELLIKYQVVVTYGFIQHRRNQYSLGQNRQNQKLKPLMALNL